LSPVEVVVAVAVVVAGVRMGRLFVEVVWKLGRLWRSIIVVEI
jgi:hypothetical protein